MKTLDALYSEITKDDDLKKSFALALKEGRVEAFVKGLGCDASAEEVMDYLEKAKKTELSLNDLDRVAGGWCSTLSANCSPDYRGF